MEANTQAVEAILQVAESEWNLNAVHADSISASGAGNIKVAILDSGVAITEDIEIAGRVDLVNEESMSYLCEDMTGHGTAVASIIAAKDNGTGTSGINSGLEVYSVKVLDENNRAPLSRILAALRWCVENDIDVVNMSFGTSSYSRIFETAVQEAEQNGMLLVSSVGNCGSSGVEYPAAYEEVMGVGSVDSFIARDETSAVGEGVELSAPGKNVPITSLLGDITLGSGTSYAAPHVTAIAATLWNEVPDWSNRKIRALLKAGARDLSDQSQYGNGLVDYEYTKSIMADFSEKYEEDVVEEIIESYKNESVLETYEMSKYVLANWADAGHNTLVSNAVSGSDTWQAAYSSVKVAVLQQVSYFQDHESGSSGGTSVTLANVDELHARGNTNYVAVTRYFYELSINQKLNPSLAITTVMNNMGQPSYMAGSNFTTIKKAVNIVCKDTTYISKAYGSGQTGKENALRVLGMAMHVAGDAYAHKAIVPSNDSDVSNAITSSSNTTQNRSTILKELRANILTTSRLGQLCNDPTYANGEFPDNPGFLSKRYRYGAQHAIKRLMRDFYNKSAFNFTGFFSSDNTIKQYKLFTYVRNANGGIEPAGVNWSWASGCD